MSSLLQAQVLNSQLGVACWDDVHFGLTMDHLHDTSLLDSARDSPACLVYCTLVLLIVCMSFLVY